MQAKPGTGFKVWTALLSVFVAVMLFPNIIRKHGAARSFVITALAVGAIWAMYFVVGRVINGAVAKELKRKSLERESRGPGTEG